MYKIKHLLIIKNLSLRVMVFIINTLSLYACFELDDINLEHYKNHYNTLPSVEDSSAQLKACPQFETFLEEASSLVTQYELEQSVGLRLIHNHFHLNENQAMMEEYGLVNGIPSLITGAHNLEAIKEKGGVPASWIFGDNLNDAPVFFEMSNDLGVKNINLQLSSSPEFFEEIGKMLHAYQLQGLLSIAIIVRESLTPQENQGYMELSSHNQQKSIVQLWNQEDIPSDAILTSWVFHTNPITHKCNGRSYCRIEYDGKHVRWYEHTDDWF